MLLVEKEPRKKPTVLKNIAFVESHIDLVVDPVERFLKTSQRSGTSYSLIHRSISRARPLPWTNRAPPPPPFSGRPGQSALPLVRSCSFTFPLPLYPEAAFFPRVNIAW